MLYYRWVTVNGNSAFLPFDEQDVWRYVSSLTGVTGSASRSQSLLQALRFAHYVFGFDNTLTCANSRRICGQAQIQLLLKDPVRQARPLTVQEVKVLHSIADGVTHSSVDRCIASNLLLLLYGRCRVSDVNFVHEILHDLTGGTGFLEISTRFHKSARTAQQKAQLLHIVMSSTGISDLPWVHAWINNRKACGLQTSGLVDGALVPAPFVGDTMHWMKRPLSPGEVTAILKGFLQCDDTSLSSHSLKATTLSWAAKAEIPRDQRRILGRHADAVKCADSFYSRDMSIGPVNSLQKVFQLIREGTFQPDASRANYFPHAPRVQSGTPAHVVMQPFTPAFIERAQPGTPGMEQKTDLAQVGVHAPNSRPCVGADVEVKTEASWNVISETDSRQVIYLSSDSEGDSSESGTCSGTSDDDEAIDLEVDGDVGHKHEEAVDQKGHHTWARNTKTKIVHECRHETPARLDDSETFKEVMTGTLTSCGKVITASYQLVAGSCDWTAKCRVCFKGRRAPAFK